MALESLVKTELTLPASCRLSLWGHCMRWDSGSPHCIFSAFCFFSLLVHKSPYLSPGMRALHVTVCVILATVCTTAPFLSEPSHRHFLPPMQSSPSSLSPPPPTAPTPRTPVHLLPSCALSPSDLSVLLPLLWCLNSFSFSLPPFFSPLSSLSLS